MHVLRAAADACRCGRPAALVTVIAVKGSTPRVAGARMLVYADGTTVGTIGGGAFEHRAVQEALAALEAGRPTRLSVDLAHDLGMCCGGRMEAFIEPLDVRLPAVVFGAGHVAHAVAPLLDGLDLDVTVVDDREDWLTEERFPTARRVLADPVAFARDLPGDPRARWLVVTPDHAVDQDIVEHLLPKSFAWLGLIGSRAKVARFLVRYRAAGLDPALFSRLSAPVGLDLGAETPHEIAIAIAAELVALKRGVPGPFAPLSARPLAARGGDGRARAPGSAPRPEHPEEDRR